MDSSKYQNEMIFPTMPTKPRLGKNHTAEDARKYAVEYETWEKEHAEYEKKFNAYRAHTFELQDQFKHDALEEVGLLDHPKADKIYAKAWEHGHAWGLHEVWNKLVDLAELFD